MSAWTLNIFPCEGIAPTKCKELTGLTCWATRAFCDHLHVRISSLQEQTGDVFLNSALNAKLIVFFLLHISTVKKLDTFIGRDAARKCIITATQLQLLVLPIRLLYRYVFKRCWDRMRARTPPLLTENFCGFPYLPPGKLPDATWITLRGIPSTHLPIHQSSVIIRFYGVQSSYWQHNTGFTNASEICALIKCNVLWNLRATSARSLKRLGCGLDVRGFVVRFLPGEKEFSLHNGSGAHSSSYTVGVGGGGISTGGKADLSLSTIDHCGSRCKGWLGPPLTQADLSPLFSAEIKNIWSYTVTPPYIFIV
jgi:hypothetical protein